jgi:flagellar basal-body rod modification protein FlgD
MNVQQTNSIATPGSSASQTVASALSRRPATTRATAKDSTDGTSGSGSSSSTSDSSTITANDFLTLLVSELQNQDPTQPTDPNAYISQLVGVNSLQQLISINQGLTSVETGGSGSSSPTSGSGSSTNAVASANDIASTASLPGAQPAFAQNSIWGGGTTSS